MKKALLLRVLALVMLIGVGYASLTYFYPAQAKKPLPTTNKPLPTITGLHVSGNRLLNGKNENVRLLGVNRSGTEYKCVNNAGVFDGPSDEASVNAIASWRVNAVRLTLNEDCWLRINGARNAYSGKSYRDAISAYVKLLNSKGIIVILDLQWVAPGTTTPFTQLPMPDADHSNDFWWSVASAFKDNSSVIFNLFNEPHPNEGGNCWRDGSIAPYTAPCNSIGYAVAGMQSLIYKVRQAGARNVVMLDGWGWANYLGGIPYSTPTDPQKNVMISAHIYTNSGCKTADCFNQQYKPVMAKYPVIFGEIGQYDGKHNFIDPVMQWADQNNVGYLGWAWDTYNDDFPSLIKDYKGTPTTFGQGLKDHLASLASK